MSERFIVTEFLDIKDTLEPVNNIYPVDITNGHPQDLCDLLNRESERADRNAELVDMDKIKLMYQRDIYKRYCEEVNRILEKYEIDSLEKLDLMLEVQEVW